MKCTFATHRPTAYGELNPSLRTLVRVASAFGVSVGTAHADVDATDQEAVGRPASLAARRASSLRFLLPMLAHMLTYVPRCRLPLN